MPQQGQRLQGEMLWAVWVLVMVHQRRSQAWGRAWVTLQGERGLQMLLLASAGPSTVRRALGPGQPRRPAWASRAQLQAAVALAVALQVVLASEGLVAQRALEGARSTMQGEVVLEVVGVQEAGITFGTGVGPLPRVLTHVNLQLVIPKGHTHRTGQYR